MNKHGTLNLFWKKNILYVEAFGPFNDEGAQQGVEDYIAVLVNRPDKCFSVIEILDNETLGSPDVLVELDKFWQSLSHYHCQALAIVYENTLQKQIAEKYLPSFGQVFDSLLKAEQWILRESIKNTH